MWFMQKMGQVMSIGTQSQIPVQRRKDSE